MPFLRTALQDPDAKVRERGLYSLLYVEADVRPVMPLVAAFTRDKDDNVRSHAVGLLGRVMLTYRGAAARWWPLPLLA